jgi:hypothetical protein
MISSVSRTDPVMIKALLSNQVEGEDLAIADVHESISPTVLKIKA